MGEGPYCMLFLDFFINFHRELKKEYFYFSFFELQLGGKMKSKLMMILMGFMICSFGFAKPQANPVVEIKTNLGNIQIELFAEKAPKTVKNFLQYVNSGFYKGTLFHRIIPSFMIQGGGLITGMGEKKGRNPIENEAANGLSNVRGTVAMARTSYPHSATSQFFINVVDNPMLDYRESSAQGFGYCVFGKVIKGMDTVDKIRGVKTQTLGPYQNVPVDEVVILNAKRIK